MPENEQKLNSLRSQSAWLLGAKIVGFGFAFILPLIVVRVLSQEQFGLYRQSFLVVTNAVAILPLGLAMSAYYYLAREKEKRAAAILNILVVHFVLGAAAFLALLFFPQILGELFVSAEMARLAPLIGAAVWLWMFSFFLEHAAVANREAKVATGFIVFAQLSKTALMCGFVLLFRSVDSILYAAIVQGSIQTVILLIYLAKRFPGFWLMFNPGFFKEHLVYALPFGLAGILWTMQVDLHYYFVSHRYGEAQFAIYAVGCFQLPLVTMLSESVISVLIPRMSELQLNDEKRKIITLTARAMQKLAFVYFPIYVFFLITSETLITTLFTAKYADSVPIFVVFLTLLPFSILISDPIVRSYEKLGRFLLKVRIATFLVLVAGLYYGITFLDLRGVIAVVIVIRIAEMLFVEFVVFKSIGVKLSDIALLKNVGKTALLSIFSGIGTFFVYEAIRTAVPAGLRQMAEVNAGGISPVFVEFAGGTAVLGISFFAFLAIYLCGSYIGGTIEDSEKEYVRRLFRNTFSRHTG